MNACRSCLWKLTRSVFKRNGQHINLVPHDFNSNQLRIQLGHRFQSHSSAPSQNGNSLTIGDVSAKERLRNTKDIYVNDLEATLEAHRATNRARIIRRVNAPPDPRVFRPDFTESNDGQKIAVERHTDGTPSDETRSDDVGGPSESAVSNANNAVKDTISLEGTKGNALKPWDFWPAHSTQYQKIRGLKHIVRTRGALEYHAQEIKPSGTWMLKKAVQDQLHRPWLAYMQGDFGGDASHR